MDIDKPDVFGCRFYPNARVYEKEVSAVLGLAFYPTNQLFEDGEAPAVMQGVGIDCNDFHGVVCLGAFVFSGRAAVLSE